MISRRWIILPLLAAALLSRAAPAQAQPTANIAFLSDGRMFTVRTDGSALREIGRFPFALSSQAWSPSRRVLYLSAQWEQPDQPSPVLNRFELRMTSPDGKQDRTVRAFDLCCRDYAPIATVGLWLEAPALSPNGKRAAFVVRSCNLVDVWVGCDPIWEIFLIDVRDRSLAPEVEAIDGYDPQWAPDSHRLAFTRGTGVEVIDVDRPGAPQRVSPARVSANGTRWSPDGRRIAFVGTALGLYEPPHIWVAPTDGSGARELRAITNEPPTWSPDGRHLAYSDGRYGSGGLITIRPDGTDARRLTRVADGPVSDRSPQWASDGRIVYVHDGEWPHIELRTVTPNRPFRPRRLAPPTDYYTMFAVS